MLLHHVAIAADSLAKPLAQPVQQCAARCEAAHTNKDGCTPADNIYQNLQN